MKPTFRMLGMLSAVVLFSASVNAQVCSPLTTVGRYVYACTGYLSPAPNSAMVPVRQLGIVIGDQNGTFTGTGTTALGGQILTGTVVGTEKLNKDCTGTITYAQTIGGQPGPPINIMFVVSQNGDVIDGMPMDAGSALSCILRRIPAALGATVATTTPPASTPARQAQDTPVLKADASVSKAVR